MQMVIDSSAILAVLLHEPERGALVAATDKAVLIAPASTPWEIGNALVAGCRKKRLSLEDVGAAWDSFEDIPLRLVEVNVPRALRVATEYGLYAYDAYVLQAALARGIPLLTLDRILIRAAEQAGIATVEI